MRQSKLYLLAAGAALALGLSAQSAAADQFFGSAAIITNRPCTAPADQNCVPATSPRNFTQVTGGYDVGLSTAASGFGPGSRAR